VMVTVMALVSLPWLWSYLQRTMQYGFVDWVGIAQASVVVVAAALLYLPASRQWLRQEVADDTEVFE